VKRKINLVGQNTLTVSLPSKWVEKNNIKKGDEIELLEEGKNLKLMFGSIKKESALEFSFKGEDIIPNRAIFGPYLRGYTEIEYYYENSKNYNKLLSSVKKMIGFDIVEQGKNRVKLAAITTGNDTNFLKLVNRLCFILKTYAETVKSFLEKPDNKYSVFLDFELECDRISLYCRRLINTREIILDNNSDTVFYNALSLFEQIGDDLDDIIDYFKTDSFKKYRYNNLLAPLFDLLNKSLDELFVKINDYATKKEKIVDPKKYKELASLRNDFKKKYFETIKTDAATAVIAVHLFSSINKIKQISEELF